VHRYDESPGLARRLLAPELSYDGQQVQPTPTACADLEYRPRPTFVGAEFTW
jgi:hypothetical protein